VDDTDIDRNEILEHLAYDTDVNGNKILENFATLDEFNIYFDEMLIGNLL
jgi:hypothetical protein